MLVKSIRRGAEVVTPTVNQSMRWFSRPKFRRFQGEKHTVKNANEKGKFKLMLSFHFVDHRKLLATKSFFEEFNDVFFTAESNSKCPVQLNCWFARDVTAAILVVKKKSVSLHWGLKSIFT